jgi:large subunit ribosomal protein L6e
VFVMPASASTRRNGNKDLIPGLGQYGRAAAYKRSGRWAIKNKAAAKAAKAAPEKKVKTFGKEQRTIEAKHARVHSPYPENQSLAGKSQPRPTHLRKSITPGTVLILLAGRFRGKRVVFVKQLDSGLLLVTGPYKFNGVPLRRVNQAYVIATSTKLDISGVSIPEKFSDTYFKKEATRAKKSEADFFDPTKKQPLDVDKVAAQKAFDADIVAAAKAAEHMPAYLSARFSLKRGQYPHEILF